MKIKTKISIGTLPNQKPISNPGGPYYINTSELLILDGSNSYDPDGEIINYTWIFNDGTQKYGQVVTYIYKKSGIYKVNLTTTDDQDETNTNLAIINVKKIKIFVNR